jgi:NitT/TauT family transport system ATP-binding protein
VTHNLDEAVRLADRIVVLSRRPGRIREIVSVATPRDRRADADARARLAALQSELWSLIRDEAIDAEREVVHG